MKIKSLGLKISLIVTAVVAVLAALVVFVAGAGTDALVTELTGASAAAANAALEKAIEEYLEEARARANMIAASGSVAGAVLSGDPAALSELLASYGEGMDLITVVDRDGTVLARTHGGAAGDNLMNRRAISSALTAGRGIAVVERGDAAGLTTAGSAAITDGRGNIIGAVQCGHDLSLTRYVDKIKESNNCEVTIFDGGTRLNTTLTDERGQRVTGTRAGDAVIAEVIGARNNYAARAELFGSTYAVSYSPFISDGEVVGMLFAGVNLDGALAARREKITRIIAVSVITGAAGILLVFLMCSLMVSRPLKKIGRFADKIKIGNLGISSASASTIDVRSADEAGVLARTLEQAYARLRGYIGEINERMRGLNDGDLITESNFAFEGDFILIRDSINSIIRTLNQIMSEVHASAAQVSAGAKQIADGAQSLAQGTIEQAASIQELSGSVAEISEMTGTNAAMAENTAILSDTIRKNAEKGSRQMDEMMSAVGDINQASRNISKIIKVIDDIAFQTNILALNAAVEAARAGPHGKGFSVVAEEVRSLAAKSAGAARETGDMIQTSMQKAELGSRIADETAASFKEIVSGINESGRLIREIAKSSEAQSFGISRISSGIDQVSQVVQHNSATAQESAAASEEMSGQSDILQELIAQFKLKDGGRMNSGGPKPGNSKRLSMTDRMGYAASGSDGFGKY